jgi:hypothetical protein
MNTYPDPSAPCKSQLLGATFGRYRLMGLQQSFAGVTSLAA